LQYDCEAAISVNFIAGTLSCEKRKSTMTKGFCLLGALALLPFTVCAAAQTFTITEIGVLKGTNESSGFWLNSSGAVVGCADIANGLGYPCTGTDAGQRAFYWTRSGGMKDLGVLPGGNISGAIGINNLGQVVGYSNTSTSPRDVDNFIAFEWTPTGGMVNLGKLSSGNSSCAFEINTSGVIAGDSFVNATVVDAASWTDRKIKKLGALPGSIFTAALDLNDSNAIVGESVFAYGPPFISHGFKWTSGGGLQDLGTLEGGDTSVANAINASAVIVGQSNSKANLRWHAVKWSASNAIDDLGVLPGGTYSVAFAINDSGEIVGYGNVAGNFPHAMLWTSSRGMLDLNDLIPAGTGWVLINANAINDAGQITGYGTKGGQNRAFLLTPAE
jgi:probable HAF family extracellular repeat protein